MKKLVYFLMFGLAFTASQAAYGNTVAEVTAGMTGHGNTGAVVNKAVAVGAEGVHGKLIAMQRETLERRILEANPHFTAKEAHVAAAVCDDMAAEGPDVYQLCVQAESDRQDGRFVE